MTQAFRYLGDAMAAETVPLAAIADAVGTPVYVYSTAAIVANYRAYASAFKDLPVSIFYAVKANSNIAVIATLAREGAGADVVSAGELDRALAAGVPAGRIVFSGVGKTASELARALDAGVYQINVESEAELEALSAIASAKGVTAPVAFRLNPDVDARTHAKITTGKSENKFGIAWDQAPQVFARARELPGIDAHGIAVHIGSQLLDVAPYREAYTKLAALAADLRQAGHVISRLDLGGGLGVAYQEDATAPDPAVLAAVVRDLAGRFDARLMLEPGRSLIGSAGVLLTRVVYVKKGASRTFVIVDAAMNDLLRPALYDAYHSIKPVLKPKAGSAVAEVDVVGPVCETGDTFAVRRPIAPLAEGDLVAIGTAGAYGAAMASTYNARPLVPEVLVDGDRFAVVRDRVNVKQMMDWEHMPDWLQRHTADGGGSR